MLHEEGFKVMVFQVNLISNQGLRRWRNMKKRIKVYKPLKPVLFLSPDINTKKRFAEFIYNNFGASEEGVVYSIRYWMKKGRWSRRFKGLCTIELWDTKEGNFKFNFSNMGGVEKIWFLERLK